MSTQDSAAQGTALCLNASLTNFHRSSGEFVHTLRNG